MRLGYKITSIVPCAVNSVKWHCDAITTCVDERAVTSHDRQAAMNTQRMRLCSRLPYLRGSPPMRDCKLGCFLASSSRTEQGNERVRGHQAADPWVSLLGASYKMTASHTTMMPTIRLPSSKRIKKGATTATIECPTSRPLTTDVALT